METDNCITLPPAAVDALMRLATTPELGDPVTRTEPTTWTWWLAAIVAFLIAVETTKFAFLLWRDYL